MKDTKAGDVVEVVLDASAVIALVERERGFHKVAEVLGKAKTSAVNFAEAAAHLTNYGHSAAMAQTILDGLQLHVVPFDHDQAIETARLRPLTRSLGLSLSGRACLALARLLRLPAITADRAWGRLHLGIKITVIR